MLPENTGKHRNPEPSKPFLQPSSHTITPALYAASRPVELRSSFTRFICTSSGAFKLCGVALALLGVGVVVVLNVGWDVAFLPLGAGLVLVAACFWKYREIARYHREGNQVAAIVTSRSPLCYLAVTDLRKQMDLEPIIAVRLHEHPCPAWFAPQRGTRIGCSAYYYGGTDMDGSWRSFFPIPMFTATWSRQKLVEREACLDRQDFTLLELVIAKGLAPKWPGQTVHLDYEFAQQVLGPPTF